MSKNASINISRNADGDIAATPEAEPNTEPLADALASPPAPSNDLDKQLKLERWGWWCRELNDRLQRYISKPDAETQRVLLLQIAQYKEAFLTGSVYVPRREGY